MENNTVNGYTMLYKLERKENVVVWYGENSIGKPAIIKEYAPFRPNWDRLLNRYKDIAKLNHPNIGKFYDFEFIGWEFDNRTLYTIEEYLEGDYLNNLIRHGVSFAPNQICTWWNQLVSALNYIHQQGILHCNIIPSSICITKGGDAVLTDFGIEYYMLPSDPESPCSSLGNPYSSPEQVTGSKHIDYRSDVYSLAVIFAHLLSDKAPYPSDLSVYSLQKSIVEEPLDLSGIPLEWRDFLSPYLAKQPEARPQLMEYCTADTADTKISEPKAATKQETTSELKAKAAPKTTDETLKDVGTKIDNKSAGKENPSGNKVPEPDYKKPDKKVDGKENKSPVSKGLLIGIFAGVLLLLGVVLMVVNQLERKETVARQLALLEYERDSLEKMQMYKDSLHREEENAKQKEIEKLRKAQKAAQSKRQNFIETTHGLNMKMVYVEGGEFLMGATSEQGSDAGSYEYPVRRVRLDSYYMSESEVTQGQWEKVMGTSIHQQADTGNTNGIGQNYPIDVSWVDAQAFCRKLSIITGRTYCLPTEAQWEYAARGGVKGGNDKTKYSGSWSLDAVAWYDSNSGNRTHIVKTKKPNELGLYDMSGNVWEWCSDKYGSYNANDLNNPMGASSGSYRVLRGGSWYHYASTCRVSYRYGNTPRDRDCYCGFRVVVLP